jgi:zinc protease
MAALRPISIAAMAFAAWALLALPAGAFSIEPVRSPGGIEAWLVEDYANPIVTVAASFKGGAIQDPQGKSGLASLISTMFDEGAGPYDSTEFQARLEELGIQLSYSDRRDRFTVILRTLKPDSEDAFEMLRMSLTELHFSDASIERMRTTLKARLARRQANARGKAAQELRKSLFGDHPYGRPSNGTQESLDAIARDDIINQFRKLFARDNLTVGIVGAMNRDEAAAMLDEVFGTLPQSAALAEVPEITPKFGERIEVEDESPQASITLALPGVARDSDDFFAAYLVNHILGGGGFTSRLYQDIREDRGLAYSISSTLVNNEHIAYLSIATATRADRIDETLQLILAQLKAMAENGPTAEELAAAKTYVIGAYAINNLDSSTNIARTLVALQEDELGIDYIETREQKINAVTLDQAREVAKKLLSHEPTVVVVRPPKS